MRVEKIFEIEKAKKLQISIEKQRKEALRTEEEKKMLELKLDSNKFTHDFNGAIRYISQKTINNLPDLYRPLNYEFVTNPKIGRRSNSVVTNGKIYNSNTHPNNNLNLKALIHKVQNEKIGLNSENDREDPFFISQKLFREKDQSNFDIIAPSTGVTITEKGRSKKSKISYGNQAGLLSKEQYLQQVFLRRLILVQVIVFLIQI